MVFLINFVFIVIFILTYFFDFAVFIKQNFMPSGWAGLAFASLTVIWINTRNIVILTLSFILAIAVAESRIEAKKRTLSEVIVGAILGILVTIFIFGLAKIFLNIF